MAEGIIEKLHGSAEEREQAFTQLLTLEEKHRTGNSASTVGTNEPTTADIAVACASPLCKVLCKDASEVGVEEYQRASQVLVALTGMDPVRVGAECQGKAGQCSIFQVWKATNSALGAVLATDPGALTHEDALIVAWSQAPYIVGLATPKGEDAKDQCGGIKTTEMADSWLSAQFMATPLTPTDDRNLILVPLLLEFLKAPENLPKFVLPGVLYAIFNGVAGRPAVATRLLELDAIELVMKVSRLVPPADLVKSVAYARCTSWGHGVALTCIGPLVEAAQSGGVDLSAQLLSCGYIDTSVAALSAVEEVGTENINEYAVVFGPLQTLKNLDGQALSQIEDKVRAKGPSVLRYVKESGLAHVEDFGFTASVYGTIVAANLYGKDEDNTFGFAQKDIDGYIELCSEIMICATWGSMFPLANNTGRGMLNLCISDVAKQMLLNNAGFIPLLLNALMLDPAHQRNGGPPAGATEDIRAVVQRDFAECIQQLSLFGPGFEALKANPDVVSTLDTLKEKAWSQETKDTVERTLAILNPKPVPIVVESKHIMMSYQWDDQEIVQIDGPNPSVPYECAQRIVAEMKRRKYQVWFDLESMKGSVVDAMSEAIDGAELLLYGISQKYKESANCRLEANYALQQEIAMVPLMMQKDYKAKGWLGDHVCSINQ